MNIKYLILLSFLIISSSSFAQGWATMNFGIKEADIRKILEAEKVNISNETDTYENMKYYTKIGIKNFTIGAHNFHVQFLMNDKDELGKILYSLEDPKDNLQTYTQLVKFFSDKIGKPDSTYDKTGDPMDNIHFEDTWKTPGSTISISYWFYRLLNVEMVSISYLPPNKID
ncbi:hypothetical protein BH10BAC5_BH10BAC5_06270 [soil metagenome]